MKRGSSGLSGILVIDKPAGITSHDVVDAVRRVTGERRVGHAGTLDPMATGLMLVCVGPATRLSSYLAGHDKTYEARIVFGAATDTDDAEGRVVTSYTNKPAGEGLECLKDIDPEQVCYDLEGEQMQLPPAYSAIKKNGTVAYKAAREGKDIELEPRSITIYSASFHGSGFTEVDLDDGNGGRLKTVLPYWDVRLGVSKGTYIRSIARDLGQRLGCGAHLGALRRLESGNVDIEDAVTLEELVDLGCEQLPWFDPVVALGMHWLVVKEAKLADIKNGKRLTHDVQYAEEGMPFSVVSGSKLYGIYAKNGDDFKPEAVFPEGVAGVDLLLPRWGSELPANWNPAKRSVAFGVFDGVHLGHRELIRCATEDAAAHHAKVSVLTFSNDPDEFLRAQAEGKERPERFKLMRNNDRISLLGYLVQKERNGGGVISIPTNEEFLNQSPEEFLAYLDTYFNLLSIHVGEGFRFGAQARGDVAMLQAWCDERGIELHVHSLVEFGGEPVSSTRIRKLIAAGDLEEAVELRDGMRHHVWGKVVHGRGEGTGMGFATANLDLKGINRGVMLPAEGVYAAKAAVYRAYDDDGPRLDHWVFPAAVNIGRAVSFDEATAEIEAHLLGCDCDIYGAEVCLEFVKFLRPQRKFDDIDELIATVTADIEWVRTNLTDVDQEVI